MLEITPDNTVQSSSLEIAKQISALKKINKDTRRDISGSHFFKLNQQILASELNCDEINQAMGEYFAEVKTLNETDKKLLKMMLFNYWVPPRDFPDFEFEYAENKFYEPEIIKVSNYKKLPNPKDFDKLQKSFEGILDYHEIFKTQQNFSTPENSYKIFSHQDESCFLSSFGLLKFFNSTQLLEDSTIDRSVFKNQEFRDFLNEINRDFVLMQNQNNTELIAQTLEGVVKFEFITNSELKRHSNESIRISLSSYTPKSSLDIPSRSKETIFITSDGTFLENQKSKNLSASLSNLCASCLAFFGCISALKIDAIKKDDRSLHPNNIVATTAFQSPTNSQVNSTRRDLEMY